MSQNPTYNTNTAIADTGASGHYIRSNDPHIKTNGTKIPILVGLPNGAVLQSTNTTCQLALPQLPTTAREAHIIPGLTHSSLVSIGQLCDAGCQATFDKHKVTITKEQTTLLCGTRDTRTGLWRIPLNATTPPIHESNIQQQCNNAYQTKNIAELIAFLHAAAFSPTPSTWIDAISKGFFQTWPGLTAEAVRKHLPKSEATHKSHLDQARKNVRSTKNKATKQPTNTHDPSEPNPIQEPNNEKTHALYATIETTGKIYTDQTGRFPVTSSRGNQYVMVLYDYDTNAILTEPLRNRTGGEILRGYKKLHQYLVQRGYNPRTHWLDNEASAALKAYNTNNTIEYQLVPPHNHRRNAAERAIRTWKNHFTAGLCSTDDKFPMHLWDRLLEQASITLNLLRPSRRNPKVSAYTMLEGQYDYNKNPMAPPGTKILIHEKPNQRLSWDPHSTDGWYLGPALEHYRCYRVFTTKTKSERTTDTVEFFPQKTIVPYQSPTDVAIKATEDLIRVLSQPTPSTPFAHVRHNQTEAIQAIADIFQHHLPSKPPPNKPITYCAPRVAKPNGTTLPRVPILDTTPKHRYPTRHIISQTQDEANHMPTLPMPTVHHWANAIIDPTTGAQWNTDI